MQVTYTLRNTDLSERDKGKLQRKFKKIHTILNPNRDLEAHVVLSRQRHLCEAEVTLQALHHTLVVTGSNPEPLTALLSAVDKLAKQALKNKHKLIEARRSDRKRQRTAPLSETAAAAADESSPRRAIVRGNGAVAKPLTLEEAEMQIEERDCEQVTFRDAESNRLQVLFRRRDGRLELVDIGT